MGRLKVLTTQPRMASQTQLSSSLSFLCAGIMSMHHHAQLLLIVIHCYNNALTTPRGRKTGFKCLHTGCSASRQWTLGPAVYSPSVSVVSARRWGWLHRTRFTCIKLCLLADILAGKGDHTTPGQRMRGEREARKPAFSRPLRRRPTGQKRKTHFQGRGSAESWLC